MTFVRGDSNREISTKNLVTFTMQDAVKDEKR